MRINSQNNSRISYAAQMLCSPITCSTHIRNIASQPVCRNSPPLLHVFFLFPFWLLPPFFSFFLLLFSPSNSFLSPFLKTWEESWLCGDHMSPTIFFYFISFFLSFFICLIFFIFDFFYISFNIVFHFFHFFGFFLFFLTFCLALN